jgi:predicted unusual protein kinase regulating ubiquinone biosynthesis (AarF/ABC1/UbiB family)
VSENSPARFRISGSTTRRAARFGALTSTLSLRYLWTKLRARFAHRERRQAIIDAYHVHSAEQVVALMGDMKGLLMKLGQILSFVSDDVPEEYRVMLRQLQTSSPPMDFALAREVIEAELRAPVTKLFRALDTEPMAAASIGQVHRARLVTGEEVAVKVQYPGVDAAIRADLTGMSLLNSLLGMLSPGLDPAPVAAELRERISEELDYIREAANQQAFHPYPARVPGILDRARTDL